jgi:ribonuclease HI
MTLIASTTALYTDGGVVGANPSRIGGTWAYCLVDAAGERVVEASGVITPIQANVVAVTNNVTELLALVYGLERLPMGWTGTVYSDSWVSLQRVFLAAKLKNVPHWLVQRLQALQKSGKLADMAYVLLDGHPTKAELLAGIGKRGHPVSEHNVWADEACQKAARAARLEVTMRAAPDSKSRPAV